MKGVPQVVNTLNKLLAGELMAVDQYLAHGEIYSVVGYMFLGLFLVYPHQNAV